MHRNNPLVTTLVSVLVNQHQVLDHLIQSGKIQDKMTRLMVEMQMTLINLTLFRVTDKTIEQLIEEDN